MSWYPVSNLPQDFTAGYIGQNQATDAKGKQNFLVKNGKSAGSKIEVPGDVMIESCGVVMADIKAGGKVVLQKGVRVTGNIQAGKGVIIDYNSTVDKDVKTEQGDIVMKGAPWGAHAHVKGDVEATNGDVHLGYAATVDGSVKAGQTVFRETADAAARVQNKQISAGQGIEDVKTERSATNNPYEYFQTTVLFQGRPITGVVRRDS